MHIRSAFGETIKYDKLATEDTDEHRFITRCHERRIASYTNPFSSKNPPKGAPAPTPKRKNSYKTTPKEPLNNTS